MRTVNGLLALFLGVPALLTAQVPVPRDVSRQFGAERLTFEGIYSQMWLPRPYPDNWTTTNAMGARVMWAASRADSEHSGAALSIGGQFSVTPKETADFGRYRVTTYGALVDYSPLRKAYRIDPALSLWTGVMRSRVEDQRLPSSIMKLPEGTTTEFAAAPALGLRFRLVNRLGIRADYRHTIVRHQRWYGVPEVATGFSLTF